MSKKLRIAHCSQLANEQDIQHCRLKSKLTPPRSTALTVLFPVFASYKALRTTDPSQLTPWLMYWVVLSLFGVTESYFDFILRYLPLYAWLRLSLHIYLISGAPYIYTTYIHPWMSQHEQDIEQFISEAHDRARQAGMGYMKQAISWFKVAQDPTPTLQRAAPNRMASLFSTPDGNTIGGTRRTLPGAPNDADHAAGGGSYRVEITGEPSYAVDIVPSSRKGDHNHAAIVGAAGRIVNAIPAVIAARPGIVSTLDLPLVTGKGLFHTDLVSS